MNTVRPVRLSDLMVLVLNVKAGAKDRQVGFEDASYTLRSLLQNLDHEVTVKTDVLESALWSCNLLNELGRFQHPDDISFSEFLTRLNIKNFDKKYNLIGD